MKGRATSPRAPRDAVAEPVLYGEMRRPARESFSEPARESSSESRPTSLLGNPVAIGIPVHADPARCRSTVDAVRQQSEIPIRLLLIPDDPDQETRRALDSWSDLPQLPSAPPFGGAACFNRLAAATEEPVIVLLESGCVPGPGWLRRLLDALGADPRHGLAGPSTNRSWNEQGLFPKARGDRDAIVRTALEAAERFGTEVRTLEPLYSLADFCYAVRREVIAEVGLADEGYGRGPCWEMDYNLRAARAGWRGLWACSAYVWRAPVAEWRRRQEARFFEASKRRYQDKFCAARLAGTKTDYCGHCRGESCPDFAPRRLLGTRAHEAPPTRRPLPPPETAARPSIAVGDPLLVSCIMPTCDRLRFVPQALQCFRRQNYSRLELIVVDDGAQCVEPLLPPDPRIRLVRLPNKQCVGAKRNIACAAARGEVIAHWDDDDWYPPDRVQSQLAAFTRDRHAICGTSSLFFYEPQTGRAWRYRYQGGRPWAAGSTLAYRRSWWSAHPFAEIQIGEDSRFVWGAPSGAVSDLRRPELCVARIHGANTSRKTTHSSSWQPCAVSTLETLLGADWPAFALPNDHASGPARPRVSCIMPTYNRRAFLPLALDAFLTQDYPNKELVIVDDGDDQISDLVDGLPGVRHIALKQRASIGDKRNLACTSTQGSIIAHWDDDDWYAPTRLSRQIAPLVAGQAEVTGLENAYQLDLATGQFWRTTPELHRCMFVGDLHGGTLVYWKRLFDEGLRYPSSNLAEDAAFLRQVQRRRGRLLRLANPGIFVYMRHQRNAWHFATGQFLDRNAWQQVPPPDTFPEPMLGAYRQAADLGGAYSTAALTAARS